MVTSTFSIAKKNLKNQFVLRSCGRFAYFFALYTKGDMSDIHVDKLNNSQLILLALLISLVVSAATAVATLSIVYERLVVAEIGASSAQQPTVVQQTINRIIERGPVSVTGVESGADNPLSEEGSQSTLLDSDISLTLEDIEEAVVQLYFGSQPFTTGVYISSEGFVLSAEPLDDRRRYSVSDGAAGIVYFSPVYSDRSYSLLAPMSEHRVSQYVPLTPITISLGQSVLVFGGSGNRAQLYTGVVSQKKMISDEISSFRSSADISSMVHTSVVFVDNVFVGFANPFSDWITTISFDLIEQLTQDIGSSFDIEV